MTATSMGWTASPARRARIAAATTVHTHVDRVEAEEFVRMLHAEAPALGPPEPRLADITREIGETGTYTHTGLELTFGARVAWRNSARCVGRLYWRSLRVRDRRGVGDPATVIDECVRHLRAATNGGRIRPVITVFAPDRPGRPGPRIHNDQLIRYAGHLQPDGSVRGDPKNVLLTHTARQLGWRPAGGEGRFDVLPLIVATPDTPPVLRELPADAVLEVPITHDEWPALTELGLRWHAVPVISRMKLRIGGIDYPAAPFNGWYMGTEIGARNLGDVQRYDMLPAIADLMGLDRSAERTLWRDQALVELNQAVLQSFAAHGVTITDHHSETARFMTHLEREARAGRECPADWTWLVPPMSGSQTPVFHRYYRNAEQLPGFVGHVGLGCPMGRSGTSP